MAAPPKGLLMSSDLVLSVRDLEKVYRVYTRPHQRVMQAWADRRNAGPVHCFEVPAVRGISFDLERGDGISIIGRNGSGKSTLLEMLAGTLQPTAGKINRVGRVSALLELGAGFNPDFTGRQNFRMSAAIQGLSDAEIDSIEADVEAFAEIGPFIDEPVRTYSSGMYVRLAFAAAVHVFPDLLIVDEALAVGDIFFQQKCFDFIERRLGSTAKVLVTHDLASAVKLSSRCLVMDRGSVVFDGPPLEAVEVYTALNLRERSTRIGSFAANAQVLPDAGPISSVDAAELAWLTKVEPERSSSPEALTINGLGIARKRPNGWAPLEIEGAVVNPEDDLRITIDASVNIAVGQAIWGYLVRDRVGNSLFGQNSVGSGFDVDSLPAGRYQVNLYLPWPEVEQGEYTITIGLGDGAHPLHHSIIAWVQGVIRVICVPRRSVHGAFNNDLDGFDVRAVSTSAGSEPTHLTRATASPPLSNEARQP